MEPGAEFLLLCFCDLEGGAQIFQGEFLGGDFFLPAFEFSPSFPQLDVQVLGLRRVSLCHREGVARVFQADPGPFLLAL
jgi:hypothetical protein